MTTQPQSKNPADLQSPSTQIPVKAGKDGRGTTTIVDSVVAKIAGIAAKDIDGVYALGGGAARMMGSLRDAVGQTDLTQGVSVEVGQTQVAADITLVVEYPHPLQKVADDVRDAVFAAVEDLVGMEVAEVNISITDIHIASEDDDSQDDRGAAATREARVS